ncbi:MAG: hypothetical protein DU429_08725 [Candidatus Tokpelaia sp.]|nr:MAG: hypothetical protein DU430_09090 [Candidatus Tokpelaia sp.]KAA6205059.1 MAG: hypothetical protein DU429_08725 [Candidatus Tokpelaia sp.]
MGYLRQLCIAALLAFALGVANAATATNDDAAWTMRLMQNMNEAQNFCTGLTNASETGLKCKSAVEGLTLFVLVNNRSSKTAGRAMCAQIQKGYADRIKKDPGFMEGWRILFYHNGNLLRNCPFNPNE